MVVMDKLRDMHSTANSLEGVKEKYKKADISIKELENLIGSNDKDLEKLKTILDFSRE